MDRNFPGTCCPTNICAAFGAKTLSLAISGVVLCACNAPITGGNSYSVSGTVGGAFTMPPGGTLRTLVIPGALTLNIYPIIGCAGTPTVVTADLSISVSCEVFTQGFVIVELSITNPTTPHSLFSGGATLSNGVVVPNGNTSSQCGSSSVGGWGGSTTVSW